MPNKNPPIVYLCHKKSNHNKNKNNICFAREKINENYFDESKPILNNFINTAENFYDGILLSDPNLPENITSKLRSNIKEFKKLLSKIVDEQILNIWEFPDSQKSKIISLYTKMSKIDLTNPEATHDRFKKLFAKLAKQSFFGVYTITIFDLEHKLAANKV